MTILGIDTCSSICGAAIVKDGKLIGNFSINIPNLHDGKLMGIISDLFDACSITIDDIDGYAVAVGPGSFTGIRIGMSIVKGLAAAKDKPIAGVTALDALANNGLPSLRISKIKNICPVIDAKRDEAYFALYEFNLALNRISGYDCKTITEILSLAPKGTLFVGDAGDIIKSSTVSDEFYFAEGGINRNDPGIIALLGYEKISAGLYDDIDSLEPLYLKDFKPVTKNKGEL